ncbi:MAG: hypothetical protein KC493_18020 [Bacteriovoracaceae bacterium]|nr:hypothetical protein [Bacteriovoracaceae bacterium]
MRLISLFLVVLSSNAYASFWQECHFEAEMKVLGKNRQQVILKKVLKADGHDKNCDIFIGRKKIKLKNPKDLEDPKSFKVKYRHYNAMGPNGVVSSTTWEILTKKSQESNK